MHDQSTAAPSRFQSQGRKPVSRDWLYQKYIVEKLSANDIAKIVGRDGKAVWSWLKSYGIPTRPRGSNPTNWFKPGQPSLFLGHKHTPECRLAMSQISKAQGRCPFDPSVGPPFKGKRGAEIPSWKGGITPERQAFYSTLEWKTAVKAVWRRDNATCQRCGRRNKPGERFAFDIHHIVSFECVALRADLGNLVLLCEKCHYWVHSNENTDRVFIQEVLDASS